MCKQKFLSFCRTITCKELDPLCNEIAKAYAKDKKCDEETAKTQIKEKLAAAAPKSHATTVRPTLNYLPEFFLLSLI